MSAHELTGKWLQSPIAQSCGTTMLLRIFSVSEWRSLRVLLEVHPSLTFHILILAGCKLIWAGFSMKKARSNMVQSQCLEDILLYQCQQLYIKLNNCNTGSLRNIPLFIKNVAFIQTHLCTLYNVISCILSYQNIENESIEHTEMTVE